MIKEEHFKKKKSLNYCAKKKTEDTACRNRTRVIKEENFNKEKSLNYCGKENGDKAMCRKKMSKYGVILIELMKHDFWAWFRMNA